MYGKKQQHWRQNLIKSSGLHSKQGKQITKFTDHDNLKLDIDEKDAQYVKCIPGAYFANRKETLDKLSNDKSCHSLVIECRGKECTDITKIIF